MKYLFSYFDLFKIIFLNVFYFFILVYFDYDLKKYIKLNNEYVF